MDAVTNSLTEAEREVVRAGDREALADLDEDALLDLHARVRRVRNKYQGQYRRQASARVQSAGGRGKARAQNQRARDKAEVFERVLARVSTALAKAARQSAADLKAERLAAARAGGSGPNARDDAPGHVAPTRAGSRRPPQKSTGRLKRDASDIAIGRRNQARRDSK